MFRTSGTENKVGPTLGAELDTVVGVELPAFDLLAVDERARATAYVHHHEVTTLPLDDSVVARDTGVRDHQISVGSPPDVERDGIDSNLLLIRAVYTHPFWRPRR